MHDNNALLLSAILIMSRNPPSCESVLEPKATEATLKPYTSSLSDLDEDFFQDV